jgi:hypothetical protein
MNILEGVLFVGFGVFVFGLVIYQEVIKERTKENYDIMESFGRMAVAFVVFLISLSMAINAFLK